jgi:hypothetical protein
VLIDHMLVTFVADLMNLVKIPTAVNVNCCVFVCHHIIVDVTLQSRVQYVRFIQTTLRMKGNKNFLSFCFVLFFIIISEFIF